MTKHSISTKQIDFIERTNISSSLRFQMIQAKALDYKAKITIAIREKLGSITK
jgi:hypothetical protein